MPNKLKTVLPPKLIQLLENKVEKGEMTEEDCKAILKEYMLREFDRKQAELNPKTWQVLIIKLQNMTQAFLKKILKRPPAEPTISMEELAGTVRARRI
jgi:polyhydroxyalkanoate synthesis regulator phasin